MRQIDFQRFIDNLRNEEFQQTTDILACKVEGKMCYCASGLLVHSIDPTILQSKNDVNFGFTDEANDVIFAGGMLPSFRNDHGISVEFESLLIELNDNRGFSFKQIADICEGLAASGFISLK